MHLVDPRIIIKHQKTNAGKQQQQQQQQQQMEQNEKTVSNVRQKGKKALQTLTIT